MKYTKYNKEDFLKDEYFQKWLLDPDPMVTRFWESWLEKHPEKREVIEQASKIMRSIDFRRDELPEKDFDEMWMNIIEKRSKRQGQLKTVEPRLQQKRAFLQTVAAAFIGLLMLSGAWYYLTDQHLKVKYMNHFGETQSILLPDNSTVQLNANSTLYYKDNWEDKGRREVWLEGEAFFSVRKQTASGDAAVPRQVKFVVHSGDLNIEVLGTKFNVKRRRGTTQVILKSGKVGLTSRVNNHRIEMTPGERVDYVEAEQQYIKEVVNPDPLTAWRNNRLIFDDTPLTEIAALLEDNYGMKVKILDDELRNRRFTGTSPVDNIDILLTKLSKIFYLKVSKDGKTVMIEKD